MVTMRRGADAISCTPRPSAKHTTMPIHDSHTASLTQARQESGGIVSARRFQALINSGTSHGAIGASFPPSYPRAWQAAPRW